MSSYAILRTAKLKTFGNIGGSLSHNYRARETHNADPARSHLNLHTVAGGPEAVMERIKARLPEKRRKDAVLCIEYMIGSSPGALKTDAEHKAYLKDALAWLKQRHGADNVVAASIHMDETTPHLCAYVVPLDASGKLNAKQFLGGRQTLSAMQTSFAEDVGAKYDLERGIERSTARHTTIKEWYGLLNESVRPVEIPPAAIEPKVKKKRTLLPDVVETPEEVAARLNRQLERLVKPVVARAKMSDLERKKADEIRNLVTYTQRQLEDAQERAEKAEAEAAGLRHIYESLTPSEQKNIVQQAKKNVKIRERCEKLLSSAYDHVTGPVARFANRAKQALREAKGRWWDVQWSPLEAGFRDAEVPLTSEHQAMAVLIGHSPAQANLTEKQAKAVLEAAAARDEQRKQAEAQQQQAKPARRVDGERSEPGRLWSRPRG